VDGNDANTSAVEIGGPCTVFVQMKAARIPVPAEIGGFVNRRRLLLPRSSFHAIVLVQRESEMNLIIEAVKGFFSGIAQGILSLLGMSTDQKLGQVP
jgi:hypothetical protein